MPTARAILARIRGVHSDKPPTGPCCLVGEKRCEQSPRRVRDALDEAMVVQHPIDRKVLDGDQIKGVHEATAVLVREIAPSPSRALMDTGHDPASLGTRRR